MTVNKEDALKVKALTDYIYSLSCLIDNENLDYDTKDGCKKSINEAKEKIENILFNYN